MNRRKFIQTSALTAAGCLLPSENATAYLKPSDKVHLLYVATGGNDANPGTYAQPFASLDRARREVRKLKQQVGLPITVWVRGGSYYLDKPLILAPEDSGSADAPITYAAHENELVTLSGGTLLQCQWKPYRDGILQCSLPAGLNFTQLFVNGKRQIRARYPNYDAANPLVNGNGYLDVARETENWPPTEFHFDPETFTKKHWKRPQEAVVHLFPLDYWGNLQWEIKSVDWKESAIKLGWGGFQLNEQVFGKAATGIGKSQIYHRGFKSRFFVENVFEELDSPGEWYLDREAGMLYLMPEKDVDLTTARIEVPVLEQVLEFRGSQRQPVQHITFSGFRFAHTANTFLSQYEAPSLGDWTIHRGGTVFFDGAEDCTIEHCFFDAAGGNAAFLNGYNRSVKIYGNTFTEAGDSAICLVGLQPEIEGSNRPLPVENIISNNLIHDCGVFGKQIAGVFLSVSEKNTVSHNHIYNMPRAAICVNDGWGGGHIIEFNDIHDTVRETTDHGPFNAWGRGRFWSMQQSHGTVSHGSGYHDGDDAFVFPYPEEDGATTIIRNNLFREPISIHQLGIDLDDGSSHYHVYNNICVGIGIKTRDGDYRVIENNIFIHPANPPAFHQGYEGNHDRFVRNIVVTSASENSAFGKSSVPGDSYQISQYPPKGPLLKEIDYNLFFNDLGQFFASMTPRGGTRVHKTLAEWQALGYDNHSIYADPQFVDWKQGDYMLKSDSPALKLGFRNIDTSSIGLLGDFSKRWSRKE